MTESYANEPGGGLPTLAAGIDAVTTTLTVNTWPYLAADTLTDFRIRVDQEIMRVPTRSGTSLTLERGAEGTTAASHSSGAQVRVILTRDSLQALIPKNIQAGLHANRPAFGVPGRLYLSTDQAGGTLYRDDGSAWVQAAAGVSGGGGATLNTEAAVLTADQTLTSANVITDLAGCSLSLVAATWVVIGRCRANIAGAGTYCLLRITDGSNTVVKESLVQNAVAGTVAHGLVVIGFVVPAATTTYKLRAQAGNTTTVIDKEGGAGETYTDIQAFRVA